MAKYYFCNGTTKKNLPCQNPVPKEKDRCPYHRSGGGGPGSSIFSLLKSGVDAMLYTHAVKEASPFVIEVIRRVIEIFSSNFHIRARDIEELSSILENNETNITRIINSMDEINIREIVAISNFAVSIIENKGDYKEEAELVHA